MNNKIDTVYLNNLCLNEPPVRWKWAVIPFCCERLFRSQWTTCFIIELCTIIVQIHYIGGNHYDPISRNPKTSSFWFSNRNIALSVTCSRNTVAKILKWAQELDISWPLEDNQTDEVLEELFYPKQCGRSQKRMPDYDYIHITSIDADHDRSMQEVYGLDKSLRE